MISVTSETATVWRGGGRRYLTRRAAYLNAARLAFWTKYQQEMNWDRDSPHIVQEFYDHYHKVVPRLAKWLMWRDAVKEAP